MFNDNDPPLGQEFLLNPYEYLQSFVRNMNNQVFLSEYQLGHLYSLLLLKIHSPWDELKYSIDLYLLRPNSSNMKAEIQEMVNKKIIDVKKLLENLSQVYEDRVKKNTFNQIERLMGILKAEKKSIYIEKDLKQVVKKVQQQMIGENNKHKLLQHKMAQQKREIGMFDVQQQSIQMPQTQQQTKKQIRESMKQTNQCQCQTQQAHNLKHQSHTNENLLLNSHDDIDQLRLKAQQKQQAIQQKQLQSATQNEQKKQPQQTLNQLSNTSQPDFSLASHSSTNQNDDRQVLSLFYGIANLSNLSNLALSNCLEYSASERYIKFKMSKNYLMTIKNQDEQCYDLSSRLKDVSSDTFIHHLFPYLTAVQLFKARGVCKQWMDNVKQAWHSTFKREMFIQLMACEFCKEIEHYYKLIQLRNPFFQKVSLLMHALLEIIQWDKVNQSIENNTILPQLKKVLIILLKLTGQQILTPTLNSITEQVWLSHKESTLLLKPRLSQFLSNIDSSILSIHQLLLIKTHLLDDPFMRVQQLNSEDKTPLLLVIFIKQLTLQQILKNHIYFSQEYLMNTKKKLDNISSKMPQQKGFLEGVYKILLLRNVGGRSKDGNKQGDEQEERSEMPNFQELLTSIFSPSQDMNKPDFVIKHKSSCTNIYMDKATKLDIIVSTVKKMNSIQSTYHHHHSHENNSHQQQQTQTLTQHQDHSHSAHKENPTNNQSPSIQPNRSEQLSSQQKTQPKLKTTKQYEINLQSQHDDSDKKQESKKNTQDKGV